ncbi:MAG: RNA polymerase sigma factor [Acidobacteriota bacterium]
MAATAIPAGTPVALEEIFRERHELVFRAAWRITGDLNDAEDVLQTVFLRLLRQGWSPDSVDNVEAYLRRAAVNAALDIVRARRDSKKVPFEDVEPVMRQHAAGELRAMLRAALARLSPKAAEMFALRYFEGYGNAEIAQMLAISAASVAVTLHRTRGQLQAELKKGTDPILETGI